MEMQVKIEQMMRLVAAALLATCLALPGIAVPAAQADESHSDVATNTVAPKDDGTSLLLPIPTSCVTDGTYDVEVISNSSFFKVESAKATVRNGRMTVVMRMYSTRYSLLYMGTALDAAEAPYEDYIEPARDAEGYYTFTIPVEALNQPTACAAYSKSKRCWYDRNVTVLASSIPAEALSVNADDYVMSEEQAAARAEMQEQATEGSNGASIEVSEAGYALGSARGATAYDPVEPMSLSLEDGEYSIAASITGGSGRASVSSPTLLIVRDGKAYARLLWSSSFYDYMVVGGQVYYNETTDGGNSTFTIPISQMDTIVPVIADTTAMGDPIAIEYSLCFYRETIGDKGLIPQEAAKKVLVFAIIIIVAGGILNAVLKRKFRV